MATARMSIGSIFGAVTQTAATVTSTLEAANHAVGMLNKTVEDAARNQKVRSKLDAAIFSRTLHQEKSKELAESRQEIQKFRAQSKEHQDFYDQAYEELKEFIDVK